MDGNAVQDPPRVAGWYANADDPTTKRWWNGTEWVGQPTAVETTTTTTASAGTATAEDEHPPRRASRPSAGHDGIVLTIIALSPVWPAVLLAVYPMSGVVRAQELFLAGGATALFGVVLIVLAFVDRRLQLRAGQPTAASGFWMFLTPFAYLAARAVHAKRHTGRGWQPFWVYLSLTAIHGAILFRAVGDISLHA